MKTKVCIVPGCPHLRPCPQHKPTPWGQSTRRHTLPPDWERRRTTILRRDPLCQLRLPVCTYISTEVDHIGDNTNHQHTNLRGVCHPCHLKRTAEQAAAGRAQPRWNA